VQRSIGCACSVLSRDITAISPIARSFQQVQKYEKGANRVSSSRLLDIANTLDVSVPYFFDEISAEVEKQTPSMPLEAKALPEIDQEKDPMVRRETLELVRAYYRFPDPAVRKRLADLVKSVAKTPERV
jgi:transcriptional regulator with XRE-family HTH domain